MGVAPVTTNRTTSSTRNTAAVVRSRRVQASFDVRPRSERPTGAAMTIPAVTSAITERLNALSDAVTAPRASSRFTCPALHHRMAKRLTERGR